MKKTILAFAGICAFCSTTAQQTFRNPVIHGDIADPTIMRINETYYAAGTSSEWAPYYPLFQSSDLINWKQIGHLFEQQPEWTKSSFWAPELFFYNNKVYAYYTARRKSDGVSYIGVATADCPTGPYIDHGIIVEYGTEAIDAFVLEDNGELYISWKAYGLDKRPIELLGCKLSKDGLKLDGEPFSLLKDNESRGMEGQNWMKYGEYYYLIYSINGCCGPQSDYAVAIARSKNLKGPYEKYKNCPILHGGDGIKSCGHGTVTMTPDGRMFYLCHAYFEGDEFFMGRQPVLHELIMGNDKWLHFKEGETATLKQAVPFKGSVQQPTFDFEDDFSDAQLKNEWTWNYPFATPHFNLKNGQLSLSVNSNGEKNAGVALCLRPVKPNYTLETALISIDQQTLQGITLYGDQNNFQLLGVNNNQICVLLTKGGETTLLSEPIALPGTTAVYLRMEVIKGCYCSFSYSIDGLQWKQIPIRSTVNDDSKKLIQWDRVARPGLYSQGTLERSAHFEYVTLK